MISVSRGPRLRHQHVRKALIIQFSTQKTLDTIQLSGPMSGRTMRMVSPKQLILPGQGIGCKVYQEGLYGGPALDYKP
jgi:hypothetical protein